MAGIAAGIGVVAVLAGWVTGCSPDPFEGRRGNGPATKEWMLVADFDGPHDDPELAVAARELVIAALDRSRIVAAVPGDQVQIALRQAGRPGTTRLDAGLAREIASRGSVRAIVEGRVTPLRPGYAIVLRATGVDGATVVTAMEVAQDAEALIPSLARATRTLREELGEPRGAVRGSGELVNVTTPSFEAYRKYVRGRERNQVHDFRGGIALAREALALDPGFVDAWALLGAAYSSSQRVDSALVAYAEARRRPKRLTEDKRIFLEAMMAGLRGDLSAALNAWDRLARLNPSHAAGHANKGITLMRAARFEEALASFDRAVALSPFGPDQNLLLNRFAAEASLGRLDEARQTARSIEGRFARWVPLAVAGLADDWKTLESLGTALENDPTADHVMRSWGGSAALQAQAARGSVVEAMRTCRRMESLGKAMGTATWGYARDRLMLTVVSNGAIEASAADMGADSSTAALVTRGLWAAAAGELGIARALLAAIRARPAHDLARHGASPTLLEAWIEAREGRWVETVRLLEPVARQETEVGYLVDFAGRMPTGWLLAEAYERLGRPDSAAACLEWALSPIGVVSEVQRHRGVMFSFVHRRLASLHARLGRPEDAARHWSVFLETFTRPDPGLKPLVQEARAALTRSRGVARATGR